MTVSGRQARSARRRWRLVRVLLSHGGCCPWVACSPPWWCGRTLASRCWRESCEASRHCLLESLVEAAAHPCLPGCLSAPPQVRQLSALCGCRRAWTGMRAAAAAAGRTASASAAVDPPPVDQTPRWAAPPPPALHTQFSRTRCSPLHLGGACNACAVNHDLNRAVGSSLLVCYNTNVCLSLAEPAAGLQLAPNPKP